jgi:hypothetical protein
MVLTFDFDIHIFSILGNSGVFHWRLRHFWGMEDNPSLITSHYYFQRSDSSNDLAEDSE